MSDVFFLFNGISTLVGQRISEDGITKYTDVLGGSSSIIKILTLEFVFSWKTFTCKIRSMFQLFLRRSCYAKNERY